MRARAIEQQAFVVAANQTGEHPGGMRSGGHSLIVDPWGRILAEARTDETHILADLDMHRAQDRIRAELPALTHRRVHRLVAPADKRRMILDAAVRVFARQGFHGARVSDIADDADVAYGLVYHYFDSKDEVLDTLFLERWNLLLDAIREVDARETASARDKLFAITSFIVDSYRHDPDVMKVIIVEVTRAANSFGRRHLAKIREAYDLIADIVESGQADGTFRDNITPALRRDGLLRRDRAGPHRLDLRPPAPGRGGVRGGQGLRGRDDLRGPRGACHHADLIKSRRPWTTTSSSASPGPRLLAGFGALASVVVTRAAAVVYRRAFGEDPPE